MSPDEMAVSNVDALIDELQAIPAYGSLFKAAFEDSEITFERLTQALAAFQRTLATTVPSTAMQPGISRH